MADLPVVFLTPLDAKKFFLYYGQERNISSIYTTCVNTYSLLRRSNIRANYYDYDNEALSNYHIFSSQASKLALRIESFNSKLKSKHFNINCDQFQWDYLNLFYIFLTFFIYSEMRNNIHSLLDQLKDALVIWPNFEQDYHFDSNFTRQIVYDTYHCSERIQKIYVGQSEFEKNIFSCALSNNSVDAIKLSNTIISVPTISTTDNKALSDYLNRDLNDLRTIDIQSPFWDVDLGVKKIKFEEKLEYIQSNSFYENEYREFLEHEFSQIGYNTNCLNQITHLIQRSLFQVNFYTKVYDSFNPKRLIISNHDGGLLGPLLSLAENRNIETHYIPHSLTHNLPLKLLNNSHIHSSYKNKESNIIRDFNLSKFSSHHYYENERPSLNIGNNAIILLNDLSEFGFTKNNLDYHRNNVAKIVQILIAKGYKVKIRDKPNCPYAAIMDDMPSLAFSDPNQSISDIATECTLCVAYESATSAMSYFSRNKVMTILATDRIQSEFEYSICPEEALVCSLDELSTHVPPAYS